VGQAEEKERAKGTQSVDNLGERGGDDAKIMEDRKSETSNRKDGRGKKNRGEKR